MFQLFFLKSSKVYEVLFISLSFKRSIFLETKKKKKKKKKSIWIVEFLQYAITIFLFDFPLLLLFSFFFFFLFFFFYRIFKNMRTDLNFRSIRINKNASFATWTTGILIFDKKYEAKRLFRCGWDTFGTDIFDFRLIRSRGDTQISGNCRVNE